MMTTQDVTRRLGIIDSLKNDEESAHVEEDSLMLSVLRAISEGSPDARELARLALQSRDISFNRWCA